ncbi:hypothetical protein [Lysobacter gummosus]
MKFHCGGAEGIGPEGPPSKSSPRPRSLCGREL